MLKQNKTILKALSYLLIVTFLLGTTSVPVDASTGLSKTLRNAYMETLDLRIEWGDIEEICSDSVNCERVFSEYYEALDAYDEDSENACYCSVYAKPKKSRQKTSRRLGTPVDFLEYNTVGFLNEDDERDVEVYECKGTLWLKRVSGEYIITKAKRRVTLLDDYTEDIDDEETIDLITEQIDAFVLDDDFDSEEDASEDNVKITVTSCPNTSYVDNATISGKVSRDGYGYATVTINGEYVEVDSYYGTWTKKVNLKEGDNTFTIVARDKSGKTDSVTKKINFSSEGPKLTINRCPETSSLNTVTISGKVKDANDNSPKVYINDELVSSYYGTWSKDVTLKEGENTFVIKATDKLGKSMTITKIIILRSDAPELIINNCPETSTTSKVNISGIVNDWNDKSPKVYINDELVRSSYGIWSKDVTLKEGENTFVIKATNKQGKSITITKTIILRSDAPELIINNCPDISTTSKVNISGVVKDVNDKSPKVFINDELVSVDSYYGTWSKNVTLKEGENTFTIKATNKLGKSMTVTKKITFSIEAPELIINNCPETSTTSKVNISGTVKDSNDSSPKVYINDELVSVDSYYGTWSKDVTLKEGENTFTIKATNKLGKSMTITKKVTFGSEAPELIINNCPETSTTSTVNISGLVKDANDKSPKVYINDELVTVDSYSGTWTKEVTLKEGENTFTIKASNDLGKSTTITKIIVLKLN